MHHHQVFMESKVENVTEDMTLEPLTDYSKFKADCEKKFYLNIKVMTSLHQLLDQQHCVVTHQFRQRLDVIVNIFANHGFHKRELNMFGGDQLRPNIHIDDIVRFYQLLLISDEKKINGEFLMLEEEITV